MKVIKKELKLCLACMEHHNVKMVVIREYRGSEYTICNYCNRSGDTWQTEAMMRMNREIERGAQWTPRHL